jgi:CHASE2 domain-containing sensor protein
MKLMIIIGITVIGSLGSWIGAALDHGNWFGPWSILLGTIGSFVGIWAGYKAGQNLGL